MILCLLMGLISGTVYYASLAYSAAALALFLFRTLHLRVEPEVCISYLLWVQDLDLEPLILSRCMGWKIMERGSCGFCLFWQVAGLLFLLITTVLASGWQPIVMWWLTYSLVPARWHLLFFTKYVDYPPRREIDLPGPPTI